MEITMDQYVLNPMGKNNAVLNSAAREIMRRTYMNKFDNILLRESGKIEYYLYYNSKDNSYWIHAKIPSETVKKFYYDIVFKFTAKENVLLDGRDLFKYNVNFFSNDPAFIYTYAHVFAKNQLIIKELISKVSKIAIKTPATEKNPTNTVGYVKTIYFTYLLMRNRNINKIDRFKAESKPFDLKFLLSNIEHADDKIADRQEQGRYVSHKKKIRLDQKTANSLKRIGGSDINMSRIEVATTNRIKNIKNSSLSNKSERVKKTKRK